MIELDIFKRQGMGSPAGVRQKADLVIIDFVHPFTDPGQFGGGNINAAIARTVAALATARGGDDGVPTLYQPLQLDPQSRQSVLGFKQHSGGVARAHLNPRMEIFMQQVRVAARQPAESGSALNMQHAVMQWRPGREIAAAAQTR